MANLRFVHVAQRGVIDGLNQPAMQILLQRCPTVFRIARSDFQRTPCGARIAKHSLPLC
jgi:hypothetical protein